MQERAEKLIKRSKIFSIIALSVFLIGNAFALFIYFAFFTETPSYSAETIQSPLASMAFLGMMLAQVVGCTVTAGAANLLSILFTSFSLSFLSKARRACSHTPSPEIPNAIKPLSVALLIVSIVALILTLPTYVLLSFFLGI